VPDRHLLQGEGVLEATEPNADGQESDRPAEPWPRPPPACITSHPQPFSGTTAFSKRPERHFSRVNESWVRRSSGSEEVRAGGATERRRRLTGPGKTCLESGVVVQVHVAITIQIGVCVGRAVESD
jgi:hypothetical protein